MADSYSWASVCVCFCFSFLGDNKMKHVYVVVRLDIDEGADPTEVVEECNYSFNHPSIADEEIVDVLETLERY